MKPCRPTILFSLFLTAILFLSGCSSTPVVRDMDPSEPGFIQGTGVDSMDVVSISGQMVRGLAYSDPITQFKATYGTAPRIRMESVRNMTRFPINTDMFLTRIRGQLNMDAQGQMIFLARGSAYDRMDVLREEREMKRAGELTATQDPAPQQFKGADFILTGTLESLTTQTARGVGDYVLYAFQLIDPNTSEIVWEGMAETKRQANIDAAYR